MSEKSKPTKSAGKSKVAIHELAKERSKEKERILKKSIEDVRKMAERLMEEHEKETSPRVKAASKVSTSDKSENPPPAKVKSKMSGKSKNPEATKVPKTTPETSCVEVGTPEVPKVNRMSKMSPSVELETPKVSEVAETSISNKLETPEVETPVVDEIRQIFTTISKIFPETSEARKMSKAYEVSTTSETSASAQSQNSAYPAYPMSKTISEITAFKLKYPEEIPEEFRASEIYVELETPEIRESFEAPKSVPEMSISTELEAPKMPEVAEVKEKFIDMSKIFTSDTEEIQESFEASKSVPEMSISTELEAPKMPEVAEVKERFIDMSKIFTSDTEEVPEEEIQETCQMPQTSSEMFTVTELEAPEMSEVANPNEIQMPETTSEISISEHETSKVPEPFQMPDMIKFESPKIPEVAEVNQASIATSQISISDKSEDCKVPEVCRVPKRSEISTSIIFEVPEVLEECQKAKILSDTSTPSGKTKESEAPELRQTRSMSKISTEKHKVPDIRRTRSIASQVFIPVEREDLVKAGQSSTSEMPTLTKSDETSSTKDIKDDNPEIPTNELKEGSSEETKSFDSAGKRMLSFEQNTKSTRDMIRRKNWPPLSMPNFKEPHLVLATYHLVPSLPIGLFEIFAEMIEIVTKRPVVLVHECRDNRPIATEVVDIVVMPAAEYWQDGVLLPASFVFEHQLNKNNSPGVYADVIVASDRASYIKDVMDLRGHKCAIPDRRSQLTAAGLLFNHLHSKGENLLFFGNVLVAKTQLEILEMVINKQAEVGVLESPVIRCHKYGALDVDSLHTLTSIGPLPPYRIMVKESLAKKLNEKLATYLLNVSKYEEWLKRLLPFGVIGFAKNSTNYYKPKEVEEKHAVISVPYY